MLVPLGAFGQSSFHQATPKHSILNFNMDIFEKGIYHPTKTTQRLGGELQYAINRSTSAIFWGDVTFVNELDNYTYPPAPTADITMGKTDLLGQTHLGDFTYFRFEIGTQRTVERDRSVFGCSSRCSCLLTTFPFFGVSYRHLWITAGVDYEELNLNTATGAEFVFTGVVL